MRVLPPCFPFVSIASCDGKIAEVEGKEEEEEEEEEEEREEEEKED